MKLNAEEQAMLAGELGVWYALKKWNFMEAGARRMLRIGLLSEVVHELAVMQGIDIPGRVVAMLPKREAAPVTEEAPAAGAGLLTRGDYGLLERKRYAI